MTRRPLLPRSARLKRTTHARTPSAKKSSESPVAQPSFVRKPRSAATPPPPVAPYDWESWDGAYDSTEDGNTVLGYESPQPTWEYVAVAIGVSCGYVAPTGWSTLASTTVGSWLNVKAFHIVATTSNPADIDWSFTIDSGFPYAGGYAPAWASNVQLMAFSPTVSNGTPQVNIATDLNTNSHWPAQPDPSWTSPWQAFVQTAYAEEVAYFSNWSYDRQQTYGYNPTTNESPFSKTVVQRINAPDEPPAVGEGIGPIIINAQGTYCDWVTFAFGWL